MKAEDRFRNISRNMLGGGNHLKHASEPGVVRHSYLHSMTDTKCLATLKMRQNGRNLKDGKCLRTRPAYLSVKRWNGVKGEEMTSR